MNAAVKNRFLLCFYFFTITLKGGIILNVKKKLFLITTLAAGIAAATIPGAAAFAATDGGSAESSLYPSSFVRTLDMSEDGLTDYAINGDTYAFAVKTTIYVLSTDKSGDRKLSKPFTAKTEITALDYTEGHLYFRNISGTYMYPDETTTVEHDFPASTHSLEIDGNQYLLNNKAELKLFNKTNGDEALIGEGYSLLKKFGDEAYAIKDNCPYVLEGETATPLNLEYTDFSAADNIATGAIQYELKSGEYAVKTATLTGGSYYSQIDADNIGTTFKHVSTLKSDGAVSCLVLYAGTKETDEISVIAAGGNCYVTATKNLTFSAYTAPANDWAQGPQGQRKAYLRESTGIYSSPYMCGGTKITDVQAPQAIAVTVHEKFALDFIETTFYRISFTGENGKTVSGFVAASFLDAYDYSADNNKPTTTDKDDFSYETNVTTVILVLVIVGLVIIAIVYLTVVGTRQDKRSGKKRKKQSDDEE